MSGEGTQPEDVAPASRRRHWSQAVTELVKVLALPLVTLVLGYWFNSSLNERQQADTNTRLYAEMQGRREEADSNLRKDMFNSILATFMPRDGIRPTSEEWIRQQTLSLELLAANFHDSLDIAPLFRDVERRIVQEERQTNQELRGRLEAVALQVIEHQLTTVGDVGSVERGMAETSTIETQGVAHPLFGSRVVPNPAVVPGEGTSRLCMTMETPDGARHFRQFILEVFEHDRQTRELKVRLYVSRVVTEAECKDVLLDLFANREVDTNFRVGLFDFPMIDNTRLSNGERVSISLLALNPQVLSLAVAYFPASRASLKDKPYYDEVTRLLVRRQSAADR